MIAFITWFFFLYLSPSIFSCLIFTLKIKWIDNLCTEFMWSYLGETGEFSNYHVAIAVQNRLVTLLFPLPPLVLYSHTNTIVNIGPTFFWVLLVMNTPSSGEREGLRVFPQLCWHKWRCWCINMGAIKTKANKAVLFWFHWGKQERIFSSPHLKKE